MAVKLLDIRTIHDEEGSTLYKIVVGSGTDDETLVITEGEMLDLKEIVKDIEV